MPGAAQKVALTDKSLKAVKPTGQRAIIWDALMPGHAVRVSALGKRSFYAVKRRKGEEQPTWVLLGEYPFMTLAQGRQAAREALLALMAGQSPKTLAEEKQRKPRAPRPRTRSVPLPSGSSRSICRRSAATRFTSRVSGASLSRGLVTSPSQKSGAATLSR